LAEKLRLDATLAALERLMEGVGKKVSSERFRAQPVQCGDGFVLASLNNAKTTEATDVAKSEHIMAPVEHPLCADMGVALGRGDRMSRSGTTAGEMKLTGHPEVDDKLAFIVKAQQKVLSTAIGTGEAGADHVKCRGELARFMGPGFDHAPSGNLRPERASDGLHLGKFRHGVHTITVHDHVLPRFGS